LLDELVQSDGPVTATELASRLGMHQSSVSRTLSAFQAIGFVHKPDYHHFAVDIGLAVFAGRAAGAFPLIRQALPVLARRTPECEEYGTTLCALWRGQLVILLKRDPHGEFHVLPSRRTPLHLAVAGLRHLLELPPQTALAYLEDSRRNFGWPRPTPNVPGGPAAVLEYARSRLDLDVLSLENWAGPDEQKAAIPIRRDGDVVATLVLYTDGKPDRPERTGALLHLLARELETALGHPAEDTEPITAEGIHL
jgi:DNA-binding IclR family transcriptional regulator